MKHLNGILVIAGKDLRNVFAGPLFWVVSGICAVAWSFLFTFSVQEFVRQSMFQMAQAQGQNEGMNLHFTVVARHISLVNFLMILASAALTMRLFTDEKRNRTYDLLLTAPVTATDIMLGKLFAGVLTCWALVFISALYPMSLAFFGKIDWGPLAASYIGMFLLTACYVAIGMFASSLTQNAVVAVILALIFNVMLWFVGAAADVSDSATTKEIWEHLNVGSHYMNFLKGTFSISGFVFFISVVTLFAFLTQRVVESARWR